MKIIKLKNHIDLYLNNQINIIRYWIKKDEIKEILLKHHLDIELFVKKYALGILSYYIQVIEEKSKIGDCPVIQELLVYLKQKDVTSSELFLLCSGFKNSMISISNELNILDIELEEEINYLFEKNFAGVLDGYANTLGEIKDKLEKSSIIVDEYVIMSKTDKSGLITDVSKAFCKISGYSELELIGRPHSILKHPQVSEDVFERLWNNLSSKESWSGELKNLKKDGSTYWVEVFITPIIDKDGKINSFEAIFQDITHQKELEDQYNLLVEQSKAATMGEMISMIAHQWRQPLQAVSILIQKLPLNKMLEGDISDELLDQVVDGINKQLEYMSKTIDDFRDYFLPNKPKENIEVRKIVTSAVDFLQFMFKSDAIKVNVDDSMDKSITVHVNEVVQVLINVLKNARDAFVEKNISNRIINIRCKELDESVIIEIEDNAGGIPEEIIKSIFDPYFSTKSDKNGTGLGLYMCKNIIEKHSKGKISVKNCKEGAVFTIELPLF